MTSLYSQAFIKTAMCSIYRVRSPIRIVISPKMRSDVMNQHATIPCDLSHRVSLPWICTCWLSTPIQKAHLVMFVHGLQTYHGLCTMLRTMFQVIACHTSDTTVLFGQTLVTLNNGSQGTSPRAEFHKICWHQVRQTGYQGETKP